MNQPLLNVSGLNLQEGLNNPLITKGGNDIGENSQTVDGNNNNIQTSSKGNNSNQSSNNAVSSNKTKEEELSNQIQSNMNPSPMLSQAMLYKWDYSAGGAIVNIVDFKTGKVLAQIPPEQVLKTMSNYQKGSLFNNQM